MAISFETGQFTSQNDLVSKLATFVGGKASWSVNFGPAAPASDPTETRLVLENQTAIKYAIETVVAGIDQGANTRPRMRLVSFTGAHDTNEPMDNQPGSYGEGNVFEDVEWISVQQTDLDTPLDVNGNPNPTGFISNYWFFIDTTYLIVVLEIGENSGWIQTFSFFQLNQYPGNTANSFACHGSLPANHWDDVQGNYDRLEGASVGAAGTCFIGLKGALGDTHVGHYLNEAGVWERIARTNNVAEDTGDDGILGSWHYGYNPPGGGSATRNSASPKHIPELKLLTHPSNFIPPMIRGKYYGSHTTLGPDGYAPLGEIPGAFVIPLDNGFVEGDEFSIGPITYVVFPAIRTVRFDHPDRYVGIAIEKNS